MAGMPATVIDVFRDLAAASPDRVAMIYEDRNHTYRHLDSATSKVANGLIAAGVDVGNRVGILEKNSDRFFQVFLGTLKARAVSVAVNYRLAPPEVRFVLDDAQIRILFVSAEFHALVEEIEAQLPTVTEIVSLDGDHPRWPTFDKWLDGQADDDPRLAGRSEDDILQLYTSGTTGYPKGVVAGNREWLAFAGDVMATSWGRMAPGHVQLVCMPLYHVAGLNMALLAMFQGATNVIHREVVPSRILADIAEKQINSTLFAPVIVLMLLQQEEAATTDYSSLRYIAYGAAPMSDAVLRQAQQTIGCDFVQVYGLTETLGLGAYLPARDHDVDSPHKGACGHAYRNAELRTVDADGNDLDVGELGEILIRGPWLMKSYWNRPEATAAALRGGWLHTGDAGYLDGDGYLYIRDRVKDMIISGGENVYPAEVENALHGHPAVADVAVIGVPDETWGEAVKAVIVPNPGFEPDLDDLVAFARKRIAGYKLPRALAIVDELPRNPSGKVLRRVLREAHGSGGSGEKA